MPKPPIFIIGCHRSGTTLLRLMLTSHSQIVMPNEFPLIETICTEFNSRDFYQKDIKRLFQLFENNTKLQDWNIDTLGLENRLLQSCPNSSAVVVESFFESYKAQQSSSKTMWGDKTIGSLIFVKEILSFFPEAKFLHIVRDGRDAALSMQENFRKPPLTGLPLRNRKLVTDIIGGALLWQESEEEIRKHSTVFSKNNYIKINYNHLVEHPESILVEVCRFLNIPFEKENMLSFYEKNKKEGLISEERLKIHQNTLKPITNDRTDRFKEKFSKTDRLTFDYLTKEYLLENGFEYHAHSFKDLPFIYARISLYYSRYSLTILKVYSKYYFKKLLGRL